MAEIDEAGRFKIEHVRCNDTPVMYVAAAGEWHSIPAAAKRAFARLEGAVPPRGRRLYGYWHPPAMEFRAAHGLQQVAHSRSSTAARRRTNRSSRCACRRRRANT